MNLQQKMMWIGLLVLVFALCGCQQESPPPIVAPTPKPAAVEPPSPQPVARERSVVAPSEIQASVADVPPAPVPGADVAPLIIMRDPVRLQRVELVSEALAVWRQYAARKPTLLLLSSNPMILPAPEKLRAEIDALALSGSAGDIARCSNPSRPDPLLLPEMAVDTPLRLGWFKRMAWAVPVADPETPPTAVSLREQMLNAGLITTEEAATLTGDVMPLHMQLRGVSAVFAPLADQPAFAGPVLLHIDLSYFQGFYKSEIATPVLGLVAQTLTTLREKNIPVMAATFSYGNLDGRIALDVRFQGELLNELLASPKKFDVRPAPYWEQQKDILYLKNFMKYDMVEERVQAQERQLPKAAWVKFNRFRAAADLKKGGEALQYLAEAVKLDKIYAMQYPELASLAFERGRPDEALRMLRLANETFPENVHIRLQLAQLTGQLGDRKTALHLVEQLQQLPWSPVYYPQMPDYLKGFAEFLQQEPPPAPPATAPAESSQPEQSKQPGRIPMGHPATLPPGHS